MASKESQSHTGFRDPSQQRASGLSLATVVLFVIGAFIFAAIMGALSWWIIQSEEAASGNGLSANGLYESGSAGSLESKIAAAREAARKNQVRIFFSTDGLHLHAKAYEIDPGLDQDYQRLRFLMERLLEGPESGIHRATVPESTRLRAAYILEDTAVVDFSDSLLTRPMGGPSAEMLCVYSIVNTILDNMDAVKRVRILVEGKEAEVLWDQMDLTAPLTMHAALIEQ